jgi:hypothetical protein
LAKSSALIDLEAGAMSDDRRGGVDVGDEGP